MYICTYLLGCSLDSIRGGVGQEDRRGSGRNEPGQVWGRGGGGCVEEGGLGILLYSHRRSSVIHSHSLASLAFLLATCLRAIYGNIIPYAAGLGSVGWVHKLLKAMTFYATCRSFWCGAPHAWPMRERFFFFNRHYLGNLAFSIKLGSKVWCGQGLRGWRYRNGETFTKFSVAGVFLGTENGEASPLETFFFS